MDYLWIGIVFYTAQVTGAVVWIPVIISLAVVISGIIVNAFIFGRRWEQKADKGLVVTVKEYEKDMQLINDDLDDFADELEKNKQRLERHEAVYHQIDKKLEVILNDICHIKNNCDKQTCRSIKK